MSANEDVRVPRRDGWFVRAAEAAGDLASPFYREERQRDVWNEACAVGLQVALWLGTGAATLLVWLRGAEALPYAATLLAVIAAASGVALAYAHALGVELGDPAGVLRLRLLPFLALLVLFLVGALRAAPGGGFGGGFAWGMVLGAVAALLALLVSGLRARRGVS